MSGLTPGLLRVIHKQVGHTTKVTAVVLSEKWKGVCLHQQDLDHLLLDGKFTPLTVCQSVGFHLCLVI